MITMSKLFDELKEFAARLNPSKEKRNKAQEKEHKRRIKEIEKKFKKDKHWKDL